MNPLEIVQALNLLVTLGLKVVEVTAKKPASGMTMEELIAHVEGLLVKSPDELIAQGESQVPATTPPKG